MTARDLIENTLYAYVTCFLANTIVKKIMEDKLILESHVILRVLIGLKS
jgi:hypothetical protein